MSARDDYPELSTTATQKFNYGQLRDECKAALDEIDRLRATAICGFVFDCGCRCLLGVGHDGEHQR